MKIKTLRKNKLLVSKDQYADKAASIHRMQADPYHEEEYWKKKDEAEKILRKT